MTPKNNNQDRHHPGRATRKPPAKGRPPRARSDADRRLRQADRLARVLRLLQLLQSRGRWNARAIAEELEVSERTVYRDLNVLELAGIPWVFSEEEKCYRVRPDFRFPVLNLTEEELIGQATATTLSAAPGLNIGPGAKPTTRKLAAASGEEASQILTDAEQLVAVFNLQLADQTRHQKTIRTAQWALLQGKQLSGQYTSPYEPEPVRLILHPYRLCLLKQAWYLIARPAEGDQPRTYRIARFKSLRMTDGTAEVPADFDLKGYLGNAWAVYRGDRSYDVEVAFTKEAAAIVTETVWHATQQVHRHKDGSVSLTFTVDGLSEILHWVLGWSGRARVVRPPELRDMVLEQLRKAIEMNQAPQRKE